LALLEALLADREGLTVSSIATSNGIPKATAHRQVATLIAEGFLVRSPGGQFGPGQRLLDLLKLVDEKQLIVTAATPILRRLAKRLSCVVQLGTLENDMVTYRVKAGRRAGDLFTKVGMQLEAYCTGMGKVLIAHLKPADREAYLANGPFPALTENTITDPDALREELDRVKLRGFARDLEEMAEGLVCIAVPVFDTKMRVVAAISVSGSACIDECLSENELLRSLTLTAASITKQISEASRKGRIKGRRSEDC
jgi:IclR family acetate operon transcriptional repressor